MTTRMTLEITMLPGTSATGAAVRSSSATTTAPTAVPPIVAMATRIAIWPTPSRTTQLSEAPMALSRPIWRVRCTVSTVKNAPTTSAEITTRNARIMVMVAVSAV